MDHLLRAIVDDDRKAVKALLDENAALATSLMRKPRLFNSGIFHWLYIGDTPLHLAAAGYRVEIVRLLLAAGADPDAMTNHRRSSPLHYAADGFITGPAWDATKQIKTIQCLLDAGANLNAQDKNGATPLHRAVRTRCAAAVQFLLETGADATLPINPGLRRFTLQCRTRAAAEVARQRR